uniref:DUF4221 family protein n=1 Tax=Aquiflexum sp. TaxID=1872584 RepID=UPI0035942928
ALSLLSFLVYSNCNEKVQESDDSQKDFVVSDKIKLFEMPPEIGHFNMNSFQDEHSFLYFFDYKTNGLLIYSLENDQSEKHLVFEMEGPNGLGGNVLGFYADNPSELYFSTGANTILRYDGNGILQEKLSLDTKSLEEDGVSLFSNIFIKNGDDFYFAAFPMVFAWTELSPGELTKIPNLVKYNLNEKEFIPVSYFPEEFVGTNLNKSIFPLLSKGPNGSPLINMNFRNIYHFKDGEIISSPAAHSKFPNDPPLSSSPNMFEDMPEIMKMIRYTDIYTQLLYLQELDLMVRVAKYEDIPEGEFGPETHIASKWGLVFLDSDFNKVGELDLEENQFNGTYIFGNQEGVWVSTDHPDNPELSEDFLKFRLIEVGR